MQTYKKTSRIFIAILGFAAVLFAQGADNMRAYSQTESKGASAQDKMEFSSIAGAYQQGMAGFRAGRIEIALPALEYAAEGNLWQAQLWLARINLFGLKGAKQNHVKAFKYYQILADRLAEIHPLDPHARVAAEAFVTLGNYYSIGIPGLRKPNDEEAARMYHHAASYFQDPYGQYYLALLYLEGKGVKRNVGQAVNWFVNAARKNHAGSQARLGEVLWYGKQYKRNQPLGLAFVKLARRNVVSKNNQWILDIHDKIVGQASPELHLQADNLVKRWDERFGANRLVAGDNIMPYGRNYIEPSYGSVGGHFRPVGTDLQNTQ